MFEIRPLSCTKDSQRITTSFIHKRDSQRVPFLMFSFLLLFSSAGYSYFLWFGQRGERYANVEYTIV